jgi:uncharacterized RDD family membrane protein YckC
VREKLQTVVIETPEHFELQFRLAGIGTRFIAYVIDRLIQFGFLVGLFLLIMAGAIAVGKLSAIANWLQKTFDLLGYWALALAILVYGIVVIGYFLLFEYFWSGSTPGKRSQNIRVIRKDGRPITFADSAIRNIVRFFELEFYPLGLVVMFIDSRNRRVGDLTAGTLVVAESHARQPALSAPAEELSAWDGEIRRAVREMTAEDYQLVTRFLSRREGLDPQHRLELAEAICARIFREPSGSAAHGLDPETAIETSAALYREITRIL